MPRDIPVRRVVITGLGVVSCVGSGLDRFFDGLFGEAPVGYRYVRDFEPLDYLDPKEARQTDRFAQFSVASAKMALEDAGELGLDPTRVGVIYATGVGGLETLQEQITNLAERGARRVSPRLVPMMMSNAGAAAISMRFGFRGPCETVVTACASGTHAIGNALRLIQYGRCDAVVTGGAEAGMTGVGDRPAIGLVAFSNMTALSTEGISRPYDLRRDGFIIAEGGAALILEEYEHAKARGAHIYAELTGAASTADAYHITAPSPGGIGAISCMELALDDAGITPSEITHINGHGTSTPLNDLAESQAIIHVFGDKTPPVTSIKGITGHSLGAAGAIEAVCVCLTIERGLIPPTIGCEEQDPEITIDVVTESGRPFTPGPVLSNSFGFGGHNGCIVIAPVTD
ncbi:MAG TPA: beta-ketoacyl-[acyl-carrier-protein] synthase II [Acidimicrobiales bacterium]|nr:beta-ketoacyl-[acyl-carrier-protein] synthase II [Acidimicrobiales bacterium]